MLHVWKIIKYIYTVKVWHSTHVFYQITNSTQLKITCKLSLAKSCTDLKIDLRDLKERELIIYNFSIMVMMCIVPWCH